MANAERNSSPIPGEGQGIELRPEKQRRLIEEIPRSLVVWGVVTVAAILIGLLLAVVLIPYPYSNGESILHHLLQKFTYL